MNEQYFLKKKQNNNIVLLFLILNVFSINDFIEVDLFYKPIVYYFFIYLVVFIISNNFILNRILDNYDSRIIKILKFFWLHSFIVIIFGLLNSQNYFEYKYIFLGYLPYVFISLCIFLFSDIEKLFFYIKKYFNIYLPLLIFFTIFYYKSTPEIFTRGNYFLYFFIIFYPFIKSKKIKLLIILSTVLSFLMEPSWRTNIFRISLIWIFIFLYNFKLINSKNFLFYFKIIILMPILYFILTNILNINFLEFFKNYSGNNTLFADTRSLLYSLTKEAILENKFNLIFGYGANANLVIANFTNNSIFDVFEEVGKLNQESAFISKLYKSGVIGVIIDISFFVIAGFISIKNSNNDFSKFLGLLCAINYLVYFIEIPIGMNINYFIIFIIIGLASLKKLRIKSNDEIKEYFEK